MCILAKCRGFRFQMIALYRCFLVQGKWFTNVDQMMYMHFYKKRKKQLHENRKARRVLNRVFLLYISLKKTTVVHTLDWM